jgi:translocation and assembly module TamA
LFAEAAIAFDVHRTKDVYGERRFKYLTIPTRLESDNRDSKVNATRGTFLDARVTPFVGLSDTESGVTMLLDGRGYRRLNQSGSIVLAGRLQLGSTIGPGQANVSPIFLFYSGGAGSVRGQPFESLGVPVGGGTGGGRGYLALSGEVRGEITDKISLVGFYDVGLVDADSFVSSDSSRHAGAGIGLRYNLGGFGPLRLDLAWPVEGSTSDGFQFYIGIGQAF